MSKRWSGDVPFDARGDLVGYENDSKIKEWRKNEPFEAELVFSTFERGRSAAHAIFLSESDGKRYPMFLSDLGDALTLMVNARLRGTFVYSKRGQNFGVRLDVKKA